MRLHQNVPNASFACPLMDCVRSFQKVSNLRLHLYRDHQRRHEPTRGQPSVTLGCNHCNVDFSSRQSSDVVAHVKKHIREGRTASCPFMGCEKTFTVTSTFSLHVSRNHKHDHIESLRPAVSENAAVSNSEPHSVEPGPDRDLDSVQEESDVFPESAHSATFLQNLALFYLKLQAKYLLPVSLIQRIVEDFQGVHDVNQSHLLSEMQKKLSALSVNEGVIREILDVVKSEDLFRSYNTGLLRTNHTRKSVFKTHFNYVEPVSVYLGQNEFGKECFAQYVPVTESLKCLLQNESVRQQVLSYRQHARIQGDILEDIWQGTNI